MNGQWLFASLTVFTLTVIATCPETAVAEPNITGTYSAKDGNITWYLEIIPKGKSYRIICTNSKDDYKETGVGILDGDAFACSWKNKDGDQGVYLLRVQQNGKRLEGHWIDAKGNGKLEASSWVKK